MSKFNVEKAVAGSQVKQRNGTLIDKIEYYPGTWHEWNVTAVIGTRRLKYTTEGKSNPDEKSDDDLIMI